MRLPESQGKTENKNRGAFKINILYTKTHVITHVYYIYITIFMHEYVIYSKCVNFSRLVSWLSGWLRWLLDCLVSNPKRVVDGKMHESL